mmetsp:Transcript_32986/g.65316  ORF Transcript_32986/g.65316 Transcript_32986/m.65316 type:complete len:129 (-) Transcript_32986:138-524(-)
MARDSNFWAVLLVLLDCLGRPCKFAPVVLVLTAPFYLLYCVSESDWWIFDAFEWAPTAWARLLRLQHWLYAIVAKHVLRFTSNDLRIVNNLATYGALKVIDSLFADKLGVCKSSLHFCRLFRLLWGKE